MRRRAGPAVRGDLGDDLGQRRRPAGTSPCTSRNASRSCGADARPRAGRTPRSGRPRRPGTPRGPATSPVRTPCSTTDVGPGGLDDGPRATAGRRAPAARAGGVGLRPATGRRPSTRQTVGAGGEAAAARRASTAARRGLVDEHVRAASTPCWPAQASAGPSARSGRSSSSTQRLAVAHERGAAPGTAAETASDPRPTMVADEGAGAWRRAAGASRRSSVTSGAVSCLALAALALAVAALEALDAATGVDQLLLAGEEGVALVAELDVELAALGRAGGERVAARADDGDVVVVGVDVGLHGDVSDRWDDAVYRSGQVVQAGGTAYGTSTGVGHEPPSGAGPLHGRLLGDLGQELVVGAERLEPVDQQLEAGGGVALGGQAATAPGAASTPAAAACGRTAAPRGGWSRRRRRWPGRSGARPACGRGAAPCCRCP